MLKMLVSRGFHWKVNNCPNFKRGKFDDKIRMGPLDYGSQIKEGWFSESFAVLYLKTGYDKNKVQLITNKNSYMQKLIYAEVDGRLSENSHGGFLE